MTPTQTMHYYREILQNYHMFVLFDPTIIGHLMTPYGTSGLKKTLTHFAERIRRWNNK